jgi:CRISPR-associated protein Csd1
MSILASLVRAYERLPDRPPFGYSAEKIGFVVSLDHDGNVARISDLRNLAGKKPEPRLMLVPQPVKRTVGIAPNFLWDKTSYALGVTAGDGKRTAQEHAAFVARHEKELAGVDDEGLIAFLRFLRKWSPHDFEALGGPQELKDQNVIFGLESERLKELYLHDRPAVEALLSRMSGESAGSEEQICLVTGETGPIARLHPSIKGVWGAQSSGAALISFNLDAFNSYGHAQGDNAPVGERAAFAYTTALNRFLERGGGHRLQIGDASTVFWADSSDAVTAALAELYFHEMIDPRAPSAEVAETAAAEARELERSTDKTATSQIHDKLRRLGQGDKLDEIEPSLAEGVRFHVLGLAPNAARLSVRFYFEDDFGILAENYRSYLQDIALEPWPDPARAPSLRRFERRTAPAMRDRNGAMKFDSDGVSPLLAGELLRSVLTGARFPASLLTLLLLRIRSDQLIDATRIALVKAIIVRAMRLDGRLPKRTDGTEMEDYLMRSDPDDPDPARRLGRLFAVIERAQRAALGDEINATVADKFLAAASATPGQVMPNLIRNARGHHIKRLRNGHSDARWIKDAKHARAMAGSLDRDIGRLVALFDKELPKQLSVEEQGRFLIGYYQERWGKAGDASDDADLDVSNVADEE